MELDKRDVSILLSSALLVFVGQIVYSVSQLVERIVIARLLTPDAYGEVDIGLALLTFSTTIALIGLQSGVPRYMSRFDDEANTRGAWLTGLLIAGATSIPIALVLFFNAELVAATFFERPESTHLLLLFVACIPFSVGFQVAISGIQGQENTIYRTYAHDLLFPGFRLFLLVGLLYTGFGILAAGIAYLVATIVAFVVAHVLLNRLIPLIGTFKLHAREMLFFSIPLVFATLLSRLLTRTDTLMLGYFRSSYEVGLYGAAYPLASGMLLVLSSFGFMFLPLASRLDANDKRSEIDAIYKLTTKWIYIVTFPLFLTFVVFSSDVLAVIFGGEYAQAGFALSILAVGFFTSAAFGRNRETISALGFTTWVFIANALAFVVNVVLNLLLIPRYGIAGAAVTSALSFIVLNGTVYVILKWRFDISPFSRWTVRTFMLLPLLLFPPAIALSAWVSLSVVTLPVFLVIVGLASLGVVFLTGCLQPEDELPLEILEERFGISVPLVRRFVPEPEPGR